MTKISAPSVNMIKEGFENESALLILLIFYKKKSLISNLSLDNTNLGEISLWNKSFFSNTHWPELMAAFYSILFETISCQFNSSIFSPIMPDDVREHMTRDQRPFIHPESLQSLQTMSCQGPPAEIQAHNIKNTAVYFIVHMGYFLFLCSPNPSWVFAAKKLLF